LKLWVMQHTLKLLEPSSIWFIAPGIEGVLGYRIEGLCAVVLGDPITRPEDKRKLALAFVEYCKQQGYNITYITLSQEFVEKIDHTICTTLLEIGEELVIDPRLDLKQGSLGRVIRRKTNHVQAEGVELLEHSVGDVQAMRQIHEVIQVWQSTRQGAQIYYASIEVFEEMEQKRWFYARQQGAIIGVALLYYLESSLGWVVHMLMIDPKAPCGTSEALVHFLVEGLKKEGCTFLSCGVVQREMIGEIRGLGSFGCMVARCVFKCAMKLFSLDGRRIFWKKFRPHRTKVFLAFSRPCVGIQELRAMSSVFNVSYIRKMKGKKKPPLERVACNDL
jgi:lysylphosphatidylglycerol synthetase-like protein (DUF2156 family)